MDKHFLQAIASSTNGWDFQPTLAITDVSGDTFLASITVRASFDGKAIFDAVRGCSFSIKNPSISLGAGVVFLCAVKGFSYTDDEVARHAASISSDRSVIQELLTAEISKIMAASKAA